MARDLKGVVVDAKQAKLTGDWPKGSLGAGVDGDYLHDGNERKGEKSARFEVKVPADGEYEVRLAYVPHSNRATKTPVTIEHAGGSKTVTVDQKATPPIEGLFVSLGRYRFTARDGAVVVVSNKGTEGHVIVDAVQLLPIAVRVSSLPSGGGGACPAGWRGTGAGRGGRGGTRIGGGPGPGGRRGTWPPSA